METIRRTIHQNNLRYIRLLLVFLIATTAVSLCDVLITRTTGSIGDAAVAHDTGEIVKILLLMAAFTALKIVCSAATTLLSRRYHGTVGYTLRQNFACHFCAISFQALSTKNSGDLLSLFSNDLTQTAQALTLEIFSFFAELMTLLVSAFFMFSLSPGYTLIFLAMFPPLILLQVRISKPISTLSVEVSKQQGAYNGVINDALQSTATIVAYGLEEVMEQRYLKSYSVFFDVMKRYISKFVYLVIAGVLATNIPLLFIYLAIALEVISGTMSIGGFIAYTTIANSASSWLMMLSQRLNNIQTRLAGAMRLLENTADAPEDDSVGIIPILHEEAPAISLENVSFSYNGDDAVLSDISLHIEPGERVAIVGGSGSGKSTLLKLMLTLYQVDCGSITIFGNALNAVRKKEIRNAVAYVPQDNFLFPETIRENLCGVAIQASDDEFTAAEEKMRRCCQEAGILEFITSLPHGFDTLLREAADNVSGGQRQRLALARALYKDAPILLLDEATSALDPVSERIVLENLFHTESKRTIVLVSHRFAALQACQRLLVLDKGRLVEQGTYEECLQMGGVFAALHEKQTREEAAPHAV